MMQVGIVARCLNGGHVRGMGRYVHELLRQESPDLGWRIYADNPSRPVQVPDKRRGDVSVFPFRGDRFNLWEQVGLPKRAKLDRVDVLHCTEGTLPWWQPVPTVVTLHDTIAWQEHGGTPWERFYWESLIASALGRCACVITISESSRRDILARWPMLEPKVEVIHHGIGASYLEDASSPIPSAIQRSMGSLPFVVYVGGVLERKRFAWAVDVLRASGVPELQLVACGFASEDQALQRQALPSDVRDRVHFAPFLRDDELLALYRHAMAVLYPTRYEGFGFPALEAQAAGAPALFSPVSSLAELIGPLAMPLPADDLVAWAEGVRQALIMPASERTAKAAAARDWVCRTFSWARSAAAHLEVYRRVAHPELQSSSSNATVS